MTSLARRADRLRGGLLGLAVLAGLFAWTAPWWVVSYPSGVVENLGWSQVAPLSLSLSLAALAASGAAALLAGRAHSMMAVVVVLLTAGALLAIMLLPHDPLSVAEVEAQVAQLTGKSVQSALADGTVGMAGSWWGVGSALLALGLLAASAVVSVVAPRRPSTRFDRTGVGPAGDSWEQLSHGIDPTTQ